MNKEIYLDSAATTRPSDGVLEFTAAAARDCYANPDSMHALGLEAERRVERAREIIAASLGAARGEIIFTSSGTEANNLAVFGAAEALKRRGSKIITTDSEHASVYMPMRELEKRGFEIIYLSAKGGCIDMGELKAKLDDKVVLISVMLVNNETGSIFDAGALAGAVENAGLRSSLYIHCDAVQAYGKMPVDVNKLKIDMMSVSAHKIHGPKGAGALFLRKGVRIAPLLFGGGQENGLRASTLNTAGILAFGKAAEEINKNDGHITELYDYAVAKIKEKCPEVIFNQQANFIKYIMSLRLPGIKSEVIVNYLSGQGIYVSSGAACSGKRKKTREANRVLLGFGLSEAEAESTIRASFSKYNTFEEIEIFAEKLAAGIKKYKNN